MRNPAGTVDKNSLSGLDLCLVTQTLQGGGCCHRSRCRLLERQTLKFWRQAILLSDGVLGERSGRRPKYLVARFESDDVLADGLDHAGEVDASNRGLWPTETGHHADRQDAV